jgi:peptide/nickel transport system substrate-binding protein
MRRWRLLPILAAIGLAVAACTAPQASPSGGGGASSGPSDGGTATGGTVRIGMAGYPDSLNPGNGLLSEAYTMYELVYDTPIAVDAAGNFVPELATDWSVSDDGLTWTLTFRDDATFHDGEPLTAEDVRYSMQLYQDTEAFPYLPSYVELFETIEAPDATTVVLTTAEPIANFEASMAFIYVLPKHIWEPALAADECAEESAPPEEEDPEATPIPCGAVGFENADMIGSGPFSLGEASQGEFVILDANKEYWGTAPNVDEVIFQVIDNGDARVTALTTGQVDAIVDVPTTSIPALQNSENVKVHIADVAAGGSLTDVFFNLTTAENCPTDEGGVCNGHPALQDVEVRRALAMAVDKEQLIVVATGGTGSPGLSLVPPGLGDFYASEIEDYAFDVDGANELLDDAGYLDSDGDGVRECLPSQDCETLTMRLNYPSDATTGARETDLLKDMWEQIGVVVEIQSLDADTLTSVCCPTFDYDIIMWGWGSDPDPAFLLGVALCTEIPSGFSESGYCNPAYDDLYDAQAIETDHDARVDLVHQMQQILVDDVPYIIPYYYPSIGAWRTDTFTGWLETNPTLGLEDASNLSALRPAE